MVKLIIVFIERKSVNVTHCKFVYKRTNENDRQRAESLLMNTAKYDH